MPKGMGYVQNKVTTHGAAGKGTTGGTPQGNRGGSHAQPPAQGVGAANCERNAFPTTGGRRKD